jgi:V8-like Glu-specific endopeptidase
MNLTSGLRWMAAIAPISLAIAAGCSTDHTTEPLRRSTAPIIGGVADNTNTWVVGINVGGAGICSGSLIAPNLVLTARHCVSRTTEQIDCRPDGGLATNKVLSNYAASALRVSTASRYDGSPSWTVRAIRYVEDARANAICGMDLALLELNKNTAGAFPTSWMPPSLVAPSKHKYVAIGYGCQNAELAGGGGCDPRGVRMLLDPVTVIDVTADEFAIAGRVCGGDSGGPVWNKLTNVIYGALSRGDGTTSMGEGCNYGIYTQTAAHLPWLQKYGKIAAANGPYAPLPWMTAVPPPPDAGPPPVEKTALGGRCAGGAECASGLCIDFGGDLRCSSECSETTACPSGFACTGGYCYPGETPTEDAGPTPEEDAAVDEDAAINPANDTVKGGTCALGFPPPKPQPWLALGLVGLAIGLIRRRPR